MIFLDFFLESAPKMLVLVMMLLFHMRIPFKRVENAYKSVSDKWRGSDFNLMTTCRRFGADSIALDTSCCGHTAEALTPEGVAVCTVLLDMWRGCRAVSYTTLYVLGPWHGGDIFSRGDWLRI